ncbi:Ycf48-like protein [Planctomycetes bacterium Poly30]|uniref:Ycf48-like protein n=1 Tax=Saltatorellus ferox TaxID=2528018 RepID=A0A518EM22_9BACT|nr:Ycf48-like protein [Planctomycetes bacterium Poly30]
MSQRILVGTRKGTFFVEKVNGRWKPRLAGHIGAGVNFVARDPNTRTLWAALGHGHWGAKLSSSRDDGATWKDAPQIRYPEGARHFLPPPPSETGEGEGAPTIKDATLLKLWCMNFGGDGRIWVGTIPGGLFMSEDGGATFELNRALWNHESRGGDLFSGDGTGTTRWYGTPAAEGEFAPGLHSIEIDPRDPRRIWVAISTAGVFETRDGGESWEVRNQGLVMEYAPNPEDTWAGHDPHAIALCPGQPDHLWQQNHCGVFYSENGAASWKKVSSPGDGVHFGFPVAVDPKDGRTAWLVPGKSDAQRVTVDGSLFVARTTDGGESWTALRKGLPAELAYDVVYRHAFHNAGDTLAFGSTTGNLYVSEDRGESWEGVAHHLPPVYSVRFG